MHFFSFCPNSTLSHIYSNSRFFPQKAVFPPNWAIEGRQLAKNWKMGVTPTYCFVALNVFPGRLKGAKNVYASKSHPTAPRFDFCPIHLFCHTPVKTNAIFFLELPQGFFFLVLPAGGIFVGFFPPSFPEVFFVLFPSFACPGVFCGIFSHFHSFCIELHDFMLLA